MNKLMVVVGMALMAVTSISAETNEVVDGIKYSYNVQDDNGDVYNRAKWTDPEGSEWNVFRDEDGMEGTVQYCVQCHLNVNDVSARHGIGLWFVKDDMSDEYVPQNFYVYTQHPTDGGKCDIKINDEGIRSWFFMKSGMFSMGIPSKFVLNGKKFSDVKTMRVRYSDDDSVHVDKFTMTSGISKVPTVLKKVSCGKDKINF